MPEARHLVLYDGVCGLCAKMTKFVLKHDRHDAFRFAALQSGFARQSLARFGKDPAQLTTMYLVAGYESPAPRLLSKGRAGLFVLRQVGWPWKAAAALGVLPTRVLDWGYDVLARNRYKWFGQSDECLLPSPATRAKFLATGPEGDADG